MSDPSGFIEPRPELVVPNPGGVDDPLGESVLDLLLFLLPLASGEPKYRVIVGTRGSGEAVGVREAFRRRSADAALVEVEKILDSTSPGEARLLLELDKP